MRKILCLWCICLFLSLGVFIGTAIMNGGGIPLVENHRSIYVNPKPAKGYDEPGFIVGYYDCIGFSSETVHYLYSPHLLFGWSITNTGLPFPLKYSLQIAAFSSRVEFSSFDRTFSGFFSNTEPGFVCGFVYDNCHFSYAFNYTDW